MAKYELKIKDVKPLYVQLDNTTILDVVCDLLKETPSEGEEGKTEMVVVGERKFGFPLDSKSETIKSELVLVAEAMSKDDEIAEASAQLEAGLANAVALKDELVPKD